MDSIGFRLARFGFPILVLFGLLAEPAIQPVCADDPPEAVQLFDTAANLFKSAQSQRTPSAAEQQYLLAIEQWEKLLKDYPEFSQKEDVQFFVGISHYHLKNYDRAATQLAKLKDSLSDIKNYRRSDQLLFFLAFCQYSAGKQQGGEGSDDLTAAIDNYRQFFEFHPDTPWIDQALYFQGESYYQLSQINGPEEALQKAAQAYRKLVDNHPQSTFRSKAMFGLGACLEEAGDYDRAIDVYGDFIDEYPDEGHIGEVRLRIADATMQTAIALANAGNSQQAMSRFDRAASMFNEAASTPDFARADNALYLQAYCMLRRDQPKQAADLYSKVANNFPDSELANDSRLAAGKYYFTANEYDAAEQWLRKVIDDDEMNRPESTHWLCRVYIEQKRFDDAFQLAEPAIDAPGNDKYQVNLIMDAADALYELPQRRGESTKYYERLATDYPQHELAPKALYYAAFARQETGQSAEAIKLAQRFKQEYPGDEFLPDALQVLGEALLKENQWPQAKTVFEELTTDYPEHPSASWWHTRLGWALYLQKDYDDAIVQLSPVVSDMRQARHQSEAHYVIGASQFQLGRFGEAIDALRESLKSNPDRANAHEVNLLIARAHYQSGETDQATKVAMSVLDARPPAEIANQTSYWLGEFAYDSGNYSDAVAHYDQVINAQEATSLLPNCLYGKAWSLLKNGQHQPAAVTFDRLIDKFPQHQLAGDALIGRGMTRRLSGDFDGAISDFDQFLTGDRTDKLRFNAQYERGLSYAGLKKWDAAIRDLQPLVSQIELSGDLADDILYELAWAHKTNGDEAESIVCFKAIAEDHSDGSFAAESNYHLAQNLYDQQKYQEAIDRYRKCLESVNDDSIAERAAYKLGWSYFQQNEFGSALTAFQNQTEKYPTGHLAADGLFMVSECLFRDEKHAEAVTAYKIAMPAVNASSNVNDRVRMLAPIHAAQSANKSKQFQAAVEFAQPFVEQNPDSDYAADAWYELGVAHKGLDQDDKALDAWNQAMMKSLGKTGARARCMIAEHHFETRQFDEAIKQFKLVIYGYGGLQSVDDVKPWQAFAAYEAARCHYVQISDEQDSQKRDFLIDQAKELFGYVVENYPSDKLADNARKQLEVLAKIQ